MAGGYGVRETSAKDSKSCKQTSAEKRRKTYNVKCNSVLPNVWNFHISTMVYTTKV